MAAITMTTVEEYLEKHKTATFEHLLQVFSDGNERHEGRLRATLDRLRRDRKIIFVSKSSPIKNEFGAEACVYWNVTSETEWYTHQ